MQHGQSKFYEDSDIAEAGDVPAPLLRRSNSPLSAREAECEIDTLRSINAHLIRQIGVLQQREAQAQRLADRDGLTGLYNRRRMLELLETSIDEAARQRQRVGLLFIDLDGFKGINDTHGHAAGDKLLITVASRIAARARIGDFVCRYGGDEFVVIVPRAADLAATLHLADSIRKRVALPYRIAGVEQHVTAAIGVSMYPDDARNAAELLHRADESMYREKSRLDTCDVVRRLQTPTRRRDDKASRIG